MYGCTEAFLADMKWILHNCIIYNGGKPLWCSSCSLFTSFISISCWPSDFISGNHKLTATAKVIVKICEHEVQRFAGNWWLCSCAPCNFFFPSIFNLMTQYTLCRWTRLRCAQSATCLRAKKETTGFASPVYVFTPRRKWFVRNLLGLQQSQWIILLCPW